MAKIESVIEEKAKYALLSAYKDKSKISVDCRWHVPTYQDNLVKGVNKSDFTEDLLSVGGNLLEDQFLSIRSSLAMTVNNFAPYRTRLYDLVLPAGENYNSFKFEKRCPVWGNKEFGAPQLDILITGSTGVIAIESKFLEILESPTEYFADSYFEKLKVDQKNSTFFREMLRIQLNGDCKSYQWLDAAQLIKHAFGLINTFPDRPVTLIYLYWEPSNVEELPKEWKDVFVGHRREIEIFEDRICGSKPKFMAISYSELWRLWEQNASPWLKDHLREVRSRYWVSI